jgi:hypothetical protein
VPELLRLASSLQSVRMAVASLPQSDPQQTFPFGYDG